MLCKIAIKLIFVQSAFFKNGALSTNPLFYPFSKSESRLKKLSRKSSFSFQFFPKQDLRKPSGNGRLFKNAGRGEKKMQN